MICGCSPGPDPEEIKTSIRDTFQTDRGVEITDVELTKQPDDTYAGKAHAANGDSYDVTTSVDEDGPLSWNAKLDQASIEHREREQKARLKKLADSFKEEQDKILRERLAESMANEKYQAIISGSKEPDDQTDLTPETNATAEEPGR